jgi:hypothetical protein
MDEQMFFDQNGVSVSNTRFIVNGFYPDFADS